MFRMFAVTCEGVAHLAMRCATVSQQLGATLAGGKVRD